jgi:hypothetical protein
MIEDSCSQLVGHRPMEAAGLFQAVYKAIPTALRMHIPLQKVLLLQQKLDLFCDPLLLLLLLLLLFFYFIVVVVVVMNKW